MPLRRLRRKELTVLVTSAILTLTSCGGDGGDSNAGPSTPSTSPAPSEPAEPAWHKYYKPKQIDAYEAALQRWTTYEMQSEVFRAAGKATPEAKALMQEHFPSPAWSQEFAQLKFYEENNLRFMGTPTVHWSRPKSISDNALGVVISQCVESSEVTATQNGAPVKVKESSKHPHLRILKMARPKAHDWLVYSYGDPKGKQRSCKP